MKITISKSFVYFIWLILIVIGCASVTPHENAVNMMNYTIGKQWTELSPAIFPSEKDLISSRKLANGNIEKRYQARRTCIFIYEIDPNTDIIVGARFEGKGTDCDAVP